MALPELVKVEALRAFTLTTEFGQFHGDPNNHLETGRFPRVPATAVDGLVADGRVARIDGDAEAAEPAPAPNPLDHDHNGKAGGSLPADPPALSGKTRKELFAIAKAESVKVDAKWKNDLILAAIEAARAENEDLAGDDSEGAADDDDADGPPA